MISPHFVPPQFKRTATCSASNIVAAEVVNNIADKFVTRRLSLKLNYRCPGCVKCAGQMITDIQIPT